MNLVVSAVGVAIGLLAAFGIFAPLRAAAWLRDLRPTTRYAVAVLQRLVIGGLFVAAAPSCRTPRIIFGLGLLTLAAALVILVLGPKRLDGLVNWWLDLPATVLAMTFAGAAVLGCFLVYAGW